jgi:hypothetical protein
MNIRRSHKSLHLSPRPAGPLPVPARTALTEESFLRLIWHERKRAERSRKPALLMLIEMETPFPTGKNSEALGKIMSAMAAATRETDVTGWYKDDCVVGVLFTEVALEEGTSVVATVMDRVSDALRLRLSSRQFNQVSISFHLFPEEGEERIAALSNNPPAYPEVAVDVAVNDVVGRLV